MDVTTIITTARSQSHTPDTVVTDADAIVLLNIEFQEWVSSIKTDIDENYFFQEYTNDTVVGQCDYPIDLPTATDKGIDKIIKVGIKYATTDVNYIPCTPMSVKTLGATLDFYKTGQPTNDPFFTISENMIRIYPAPLVALSDGAYLAALYTPIDLVLGGSESSIPIPRQHQQGILYGLMARMFQKRGLVNDEAFYKAEAKKAKMDMIKNMGSRVNSPITRGTPDTSDLE